MATVPQTMRAMRLHTLGAIAEGAEPLKLEHIPVPSPGAGEVLVRIKACGVCHTELDEIEARTAPPALPVTLGHQLTGRVIAEGPGCDRGLLDRDVGIAWIGGACVSCKYCERGFANLCPEFVATGRDRDGGYAELIALEESFVHP
ncbi:MAG TPA: alcohol dehydrogenase catalytic domain-containing protein, partial [Xanthomonadales bacterium]|nr:alcohol dehydrogenase catalytic domain-containing protein [Xanthomonadales bacterium]